MAQDTHTSNQVVENEYLIKINSQFYILLSLLYIFHTKKEEIINLDVNKLTVINTLKLNFHLLQLLSITN